MTLVERMDPFRPYFAVIRWGLAVALLLAAFVGGCRHGRGVERGKHVYEAVEHATQVASLTHQLAAASATLAAVNEAADMAIAEAKKLEHASVVASEVHANEAARLRREANNYQGLLQQVKQARPSCKVLLETDLKKECGL